MIKQRDSYTITLPKMWVKDQDIEQVDELEVEFQEDNLLISPLSDTKRQKKVHLDLKSSNPDHIKNLIRNLYLHAYDLIDIVFYDEKDINAINEIVNRLIGYEIIEQDAESCTIKDIAGEKGEDFEIIYRKLWRTINLMGELVVDALTTGATTTDTIKIDDLNHNNSRFAAYTRRAISKHLIRSDKGLSDYIIITRLFMIGRNFYWIYEFLSSTQFKIKKSTLDFVKKYLRTLDSFYEFYYDQNMVLGKETKKLTEEMVKESYLLLQKDATKNSVVLFRIAEAIRFISSSVAKAEIVKLLGRSTLDTKDTSN